MREIKFRAWNRHTKKMIDSPMCNSGWLNEMFCNQLGEHTGSDYMQYTGLKDKNGKEIFESDIVRVSKDFVNYFPTNDLENDFNVEVKYRDVMFYPLYICGSNCEVIGNIYENPELLTN